jgi:phosphoglycolate phosphatase
MRQPFEIVRSDRTFGPLRTVVFDFDGTISLLREGWARLMAELGRDRLAADNLVVEPEPFLLRFLEREMLLLSGKPSIFQMRRLAEEAERRGGRPLDPDELLAEFLDRLQANIEGRIHAIRSGAVSPDAWTVPGTRVLLECLRSKGVNLVLASGTDRDFVVHDLELLDLARYFGDRVHAPRKNGPPFSKRAVLDGLLADGLHGPELLGFGDGYAETVEVKRLGGVAIGVASVEPPATGVHAMKREMLIELGADAIIPDYENSPALLEWLGV